MSETESNRQLMQHAFGELSLGNTSPFRDLMAEDLRWTIIGSTPWSGTYSGKDSVLNALMAPLFAQFANRYTNRAVRIIADREHVVVECLGQVTTTSGRAYNNSYCYVCRMAGGKLRELTEYCDTQLIATVLAAPC